MTYFQRKIDKLERMLKGRTRADGSPRAGFEQNVAQLRAQIELMTTRGELHDGE